METQNELFPLPKKQQSFFGKAKGTILGESPVNLPQYFFESAEGKNNPRPAEIKKTQSGLKTPSHRCDPNKPATRQCARDNEDDVRIEKFGPNEIAKSEDCPNELSESQPLTDVALEPLTTIEEVGAIPVDGQIIQIDPTVENPYERKESFWQFTRRLFQRWFGD